MADHLFVTTRTTEPDQVALGQAVQALDPAAILVWRDEAHYRITKPTPWTAPQITAAQNAIDTAPELTAQGRFQQTSRQKDVLATCALIVRARGIATWNAMTVQQKKDATFAEADVWVNIREFIEANL